MGVIIIAEAGVNHNGSLEMAKQLVDEAVNAGADYIKFQTFRSEKIVSRHAQAAQYQKENLKEDVGQFDMLKKLELGYEDFRELKTYCEKKGIGFISTPFDLESLSFLNELGMDFWKLPSGEMTNLPYLEAMAKTRRPIILSTGMCNLEEVAEALEVLTNNGAEDITILQCNTQYPTLPEDVNLRAMYTMKEKFGYPVGYSDHTQGISIPLAAVAMGAEVIEKHFTLSHELPGPDHVASLEPDELQAMVEGIRQIERAMGTGEKVPSTSEMENIVPVRKSIVANIPIHKGEIITEKHLSVKRPGDGISPMKWYEVIGRKADRDYAADEQIGFQIMN